MLQKSNTLDTSPSLHSKKSKGKDLRRKGKIQQLTPPGTVRGQPPSKMPPKSSGVKKARENDKDSKKKRRGKNNISKKNRKEENRDSKRLGNKIKQCAWKSLSYKQRYKLAKRLNMSPRKLRGWFKKNHESTKPEAERMATGEPDPVDKDFLNRLQRCSMESCKAERQPGSKKAPVNDRKLSCLRANCNIAFDSRNQTNWKRHIGKYWPRSIWKRPCGETILHRDDGRKHKKPNGELCCKFTGVVNRVVFLEKCPWCPSSSTFRDWDKFFDHIREHFTKKVGGIRRKTKADWTKPLPTHFKYVLSASEASSDSNETENQSEKHDDEEEEVEEEEGEEKEEEEEEEERRRRRRRRRRMVIRANMVSTTIIAATREIIMIPKGHIDVMMETLEAVQVERAMAMIQGHLGSLIRLNTATQSILEITISRYMAQDMHNNPRHCPAGGQNRPARASIRFRILNTICCQRRRRLFHLSVPNPMINSQMNTGMRHHEECLTYRNFKLYGMRQVHWASDDGLALFLKI